MTIFCVIKNCGNLAGNFQPHALVGMKLYDPNITGSPLVATLSVGKYYPNVDPCSALEMSSNSLILPILNNIRDLLSRNTLCYLVMISRKAANNILQGTNKMHAEYSAPKELLVKYKDQEDSA